MHYIYINRIDLRTLFKSLIKVSEKCLLTIENNTLRATVSKDRAFGLDAIIKLSDAGDNSESLKLRILDTSAMLKLCERATDDEICLIIDENGLIKYTSSDKRIKLKIHQGDEIHFSQFRASKFDERIKDFELCFKETFLKKELAELDVGISFVKRSISDPKLYFYCEGEEFIGEMSDRTTKKSDSFNLSLKSGCNILKKASNPIVVKYDHWNLVNFFSESVDISIYENDFGNRPINFILFEQNTENMSIKFTFVSLIENE